MYLLGRLRTLCFVVLCVSLAACNSGKDVEDLMQKQSVFPTEQGQEVEILYTDSGQVRIRITAPVMNHYTLNVPESYTEMPQGVFIEFYNDSNKIKTTLRADYGIRYEHSKRTEVKSRVEVVNSSGEVLNTDKLNWDENSRRIYTDVFVQIRTSRDVLKGTGLEANEDFSEWEIKNPVGTAIAPGEEGN